jgi:hypothetical protein
VLRTLEQRIGSELMPIDLKEIYSLLIRIQLTEFTIFKKTIGKILTLTSEIIQAGIFSKNLAKQ